jgi:UDP-N-acetylmuramoyl-L-alanyl-D-glutamate--2,6-diaminopimelate ligase
VPFNCSVPAFFISDCFDVCYDIHMLSLIKKIIPRQLFLLYHWVMAKVAVVLYGWPSNQLIVIGVTGTKGKTTTSNLIAEVLYNMGHKIGLTSTAILRINDKQWLNPKKMTMPGRFTLQRMMRQMVREGVRYAVIESSSEGVVQYRHAGINYDVMVFTNLSPEHIEAHGSYEAYREAKAKLFRHLKNSPLKKIDGQEIKKSVILNSDDVESKFFSSFNAGEEWWYGLDGKYHGQSEEHYIHGTVVEMSASGLRLDFRGHNIAVPLLGKMNVYNALATLATTLSLGQPLEKISTALGKLKPVPGRQEFIDTGQPFKVVVDYAYEPTSIAALYAVMALVPHRRVIHVLGPTGGGRDVWRRPVLGELAAHHANIVIATTDDPYDEDPALLMDEMVAGAEPIAKTKDNFKLLKIVDRREAIREALKLAEPDDLVLVTGKGAEQTMAIGGKYVPWDDRRVIREELDGWLKNFAKADTKG